MKRRYSIRMLLIGGLLASLGSFFFVRPVFSANLMIVWDANTEPDISGYNIYFQKSSDGPPYHLFGSVSLQEIDPANPSFLITGLEDDAVYYLTVTALDTEGYESVYSTSACTEIVGGAAQPCSTSGGASGDGGGSAGGGGGGGGCFIGSLYED